MTDGLFKTGDLFVCFLRATNRFMAGGERLVDVNSRILRHIEHPDDYSSPFGDAVKPLEIYASLSEALNWADTLDGRIAHEWPFGGDGREWWLSVQQGRTVRAFRYARNSVHHDWTMALQRQPAVEAAPLTRGDVMELIWIADLTSSRPDAYGAASYASELAEQSVVTTAAALMVAFGEGVRRLLDHEQGIERGYGVSEIQDLSPEDLMAQARKIGETRFDAYRNAW